MSITRVVCPKCGVGGANDGPCFCHKCEGRVVMLPAVNDRITGKWPKTEGNEQWFKRHGLVQLSQAGSQRDSAFGNMIEAVSSIKTDTPSPTTITVVGDSTLRELQGLKGHVFGFDPAKPDMCKCSECGGKFNVSDCLSEWGHHYGWEMPAYNEISCPKCEDGGCVDDYFFSTDKER